MTSAIVSAVRRYLIAGLLVWLPFIVTVLVVRFILELIGNSVLLLPAQLQPDRLLGVHVPGLGVLVAVLVLLLTGALVSNIIGRSLVRFWEKLLNRIPFVRSIYSGVKSFSSTILSNTGNSFKKVLLVEYPRTGLWSIAFQTAADVPTLSVHIGEPSVCVFIPTTPNPTAGFIILVPRSQVIETDMSVDAAMKMIVTLGVVVPTEQIPALAAAPGAVAGAVVAAGAGGAAASAEGSAAAPNEAPRERESGP